MCVPLLPHGSEFCVFFYHVAPVSPRSSRSLRLSWTPGKARVAHRPLRPRDRGLVHCSGRFPVGEVDADGGQGLPSQLHTRGT